MVTVSFRTSAATLERLKEDAAKAGLTVSEHLNLILLKSLGDGKGEVEKVEGLDEALTFFGLLFGQAFKLSFQVDSIASLAVALSQRLRGEKKVKDVKLEKGKVIIDIGPVEIEVENEKFSDFMDFQRGLVKLHEKWSEMLREKEKAEDLERFRSFLEVVDNGKES